MVANILLGVRSSMLINYMEIVIDNLIPTVLDKYSYMCTCQKCIEDIKAISLNRLKPLYVVSEEGQLYIKVNELTMQFKVDAITEIVRAIDIVSNNPKHSSI